MSVLVLGWTVGNLGNLLLSNKIIHCTLINGNILNTNLHLYYEGEKRPLFRQTSLFTELEELRLTATLVQPKAYKLCQQDCCQNFMEEALANKIAIRLTLCLMVTAGGLFSGAV